MLSRRQFASRSILAALTASLPFALSGCNVFSDILAWTSVAGTALDGIVAVLGPLVSLSAFVYINTAKAFLSNLANAVAAYQSDTNPADKATLLAEIRTFLTDVASNMQSFFLQIAGASPVINIALGLGQIVLAAIAGFLNQLPPGGAVRLNPTLSAIGRSVPITPKYYKTVGEFKRDFNAAATAGGHPEIGIK
jgi:hypothetical protein